MDEIKAGSLVRAVKGRGRSAVEGVVTATRYIGDTQWTLDNARQCGYEVTVLEEPPAPALPTEPGWYLDRYRDVVYLAKDGTWTTSTKHGVSESELREWLPLTPLEQVPVTVQKVIDYLVDTNFMDADWPICNTIRAAFGVSS